MALASEALDSARVYLNDTKKQIWTDTTLIPYLKEAYRDLLLVLWLNGMPVIKEKSATINVNANALDLGVNQPADLIEPISLKERTQGSSESWIPMVEVGFEPDISKDTILRYWDWREEKIVFVGATSNREVLLRYWKSLTLPVDATTPLGFIFAEIFLGPQTAGYAAGSVGNTTLAGELLYVQSQAVGIAGGKLDMIVRANVKGSQNLPARRIPYRRFDRNRLLF